MKKLILTLLIFLVSSLPVKADDPLVLDPIIDHLRLAMEDDKELQYSLKRCAGLFLASGTALHKLVEENHPDRPNPDCTISECSPAVWVPENKLCLLCLYRGQ